ncbi:hypothetical protein [Microbacterium sp.]|uniref:hypothetical protein n=1 Tax=Microbacterium sp. TaxID=51671 RepID=UPI00281209A5|nr:hypothetical protein [Microbacterium sp.]
MTTANQVTSRGDGFALGLIATGAASVGIGALVAIVLSTIGATEQAVTISQMPIAAEEAGAPLGGAQPVVGSAYETASVTFSVLPAGIRSMLWAESVLPAIATIGVCAIAWWLAVSLMRARPFRRAMSTAIAVVSVLVIVGGTVGQLLGAFARAAAVEFLATDGPGAEPFSLFLLELDLAPIGWGFALALIAGAFGIGSRLQRDTEGLV